MGGKKKKKKRKKKSIITPGSRCGACVLNPNLNLSYSGGIKIIEPRAIG
jgi:hypothetical protein